MDTVASAHGITLVSELSRLDVDDRPFRAATARGDLVRVHRGAYVSAEEWAGLDRYERYRRQVVAVSLASRSRPVLTHESAAAVWGMPTLGRRGEVVHVLTTPAAGTRTENGVRRHAMDVAEEDVLESGGVRFTSLRRTLLDLMREAPFASATASLDWALRHHPRAPKPTIDPLVLAEYVAASGLVRNSRRVGRVLQFADPRAESPGESLSRVAIAELGFPAPELQVDIRDVNGVAGRVDFYWPAHRLVGEFDGDLKYDPEVVGHPSALLDEKRREDRIRRTGNGVARWDWKVAWVGPALYRRLTEAGLPSVLRTPQPGPIRSLGAGVAARISRFGPGC
ncbi:hypothetical protein [Naasia sp. SYSU D00948]|uniref:hypothetical protein n=1 Tax=Naasia sp. SYSU D00948 TaxID=2817379 RepID=UPI001B315B54|nr:hypothetical protein [Naasia sp. SYSU D00948]